MDFEELRTLQRKERNTQKIVDVSASFYEDLSDLVREYKKKYDSTQNPKDLKDVENIYKIATDIFERREHKLLLKALCVTRTNESEKLQISAPEEKTFASLIEVLKNNRNAFDNVLMGIMIPAKQICSAKQVLDSIPEAENGAIKQSIACKETPFGSEVVNLPVSDDKDLNNVLVKIIKHVPKFVAADLQELGPFDINEVVKLPVKEAELLSKREYLEIMG